MIFKECCGTLPFVPEFNVFLFYAFDLFLIFGLFWHFVFVNVKIVYIRRRPVRPGTFAFLRPVRWFRMVRLLASQRDSI